MNRPNGLFIIFIFVTRQSDLFLCKIIRWVDSMLIVCYTSFIKSKRLEENEKWIKMKN